MDADPPAPKVSPLEISSKARAEIRLWLERWRTLGPLLDEERWSRLSASSDAQLRPQALDVLALWEPTQTGDDGEGIQLVQSSFAAARERA